LREFSGMPIYNYASEEQSSDEFYKVVTEADNNGWAMVASCSHEHAGLITGHAYSLLGAVKLDGGP